MITITRSEDDDEREDIVFQFYNIQ